MTASSDTPRADANPGLRIVVVGAGAVGGYAGAMLARAGHDVVLVARGAHADAMDATGVTVELPAETFSVPARVVRRIEDAGSGADVVLVSVKAKDLPGVAEPISRLLAPGGVAIPLLNGVDSEAVLAEKLGADHVVGGIAQIAARVVAPGRVRVDGPARLVLAPVSPAGLPVAERVARALTCPGIVCDARPDLKRILWGKLLWNAPFNAVCALTRKTAGEVLAVPELEALLRAAMREVVLVARAEGAPLKDELVEENIRATRQRYTGSVPSMLEDVLRNRETEARALQGAVVERGKRHGIPTPVHDVLLALMLGTHPASSG